MGAKDRVIWCYHDYVLRGTEMNKRERVQATLKGEPVDRPSRVSRWIARP